MQKWEYCTLIAGRSKDENPYSLVTVESNKLGDEGWELAGVVSESTGYYAMLIFKRPKA